MMQNFDMMGGWGGMWMASLYMVVIPILVIVAIIWLVRLIAGSSRNSGERRTTPGEILDQRFAKGELNEEEYKRRRDILNAKATLER